MRYIIGFIGILLHSCVFFGPSKEELFSRAEKNKPYDVIIVPGFPYDSSSKEWPMAMKGRIYWAKFLLEKGIANHVIFSGSSVYTPFVESKIMAQYGIKIGIPADKIFMETKAEHSTENVYYSYYLAKRLGFSKIAVATDPFQAKALKGMPKRFKMDLDFIPFVIDTLATIPKVDQVEINSDSSSVENFVSIYDRESRFKRWWGTMGGNIKRDSLDERNKKQ